MSTAAHDTHAHAHTQRACVGREAGRSRVSNTDAISKATPRSLPPTFVVRRRIQQQLRGAVPPRHHVHRQVAAAATRRHTANQSHGAMHTKARVQTRRGGGGWGLMPSNLFGAVPAGGAVSGAGSSSPSTPTARARPKSAMTSSQLALTSTFCGFRSRCSTPAVCTNLRPRSSWYVKYLQWAVWPARAATVACVQPRVSAWRRRPT